MKDSRKGFSLIELMIYIAIFSVSSSFLVAILTAVTRIQVKQRSMNEVNHQLAFVTNTVQRLVQESSVIDVQSGTVTSTLRLRMASSSLDPTLIFASSSAVYLKEGSNEAIALTDSKVVVDSILVEKSENSGGKAIVQVSIAVRYNTTDEKSKFNRTIQTAVTRVSAASFDSDLLPNSSNSYDLGNASYNWKNAYFAGGIGVGVPPVFGAKIKTDGDLAFSTSTVGMVLMSSNGTCYRVGISNAGAFSTSSISCP